MQLRSEWQNVSLNDVHFFRVMFVNEAVSLQVWQLGIVLESQHHAEEHQARQDWEQPQRGNPGPRGYCGEVHPHGLVRLSMCYQCERKMKSRSSWIHCTLGLCIIAAGAGSYWIPTCKEHRTVLGHSKLSLNVSFQLSKWKSQYLKTESTVCLQSPQRRKRESY